MKKTLFSFIFATILGLSSAWAQSNNYDFWSVASNGDTLFYKIINDSSVQVVNPDYSIHIKPQGGLVIPSNVYFDLWNQWYNVSSIGNNAFSGCDSLVLVSLPESISSIGSYAFYNCVRLVQINIPQNVDTISNSTFYGCSALPGIVLPNGLIVIGEYAFYGCSSMVSISLPLSLKRIGVPYPGVSSSFHGCTALQSIEIPDSVTYVGPNCFQSCSNLESVVIGNSVGNICGSTFYNCTNLKNVTIGASVSSIGREAFANCNKLESIVIPDNVHSLNFGAFYNCIGLKKIRIGTGLTTITKTNPTYGNDNKLPFEGCDSVRCLVINSQLTSVPSGYYAYNNFSVYGINEEKLESLYIGDNVTVFSPGYCPLLDTLYVGVNLQTCDLIREIGNQVTGRTAPRYLLYNRRGTAYSMGSNYGHYYNDQNGKLYGVSSSRLETLIYGDSAISVISIGGDSLRTLVIGNGITNIPANRYQNCSNLRKVTLGRNVSNIGGNAFYRCMSLDTIFALPNNAPSLDSGAFAVTRPNKKVIVPCNSNYDSVWGTTGFVYITGGYTLTLNSNNTAWGNASFLQQVDCDQTAIIEATPTVGHRFVQWSDGNNDNPRTITLSQNTTLTAVFEAYNVNVSATSNNEMMGTVVGGGSIPVNGEVTLSASPVCGHRFVMWNDSITSNPRTFIADKDTSFIAYFELAVDTIELHDTTYINVLVHDTTIIIDTVTLTEYVPVHDTTYIDVHDTTLIHDTIFIHDTIVVGVGDVETVNAKIYTNNRQIVVEGADGNDVWLYDVNGRILAIKQDYGMPIRFDAPDSGTYMIKIGNYPARKVVVIR